MFRVGRKSLPRLLTVLVVAAALTAAGCGRRITVKGKVTVGETPLTYGSVLFIPDKDKENTSTVSPRGLITPDGTYELNESVPPGWYKVVVSATEETSGDNAKTDMAPAKSLIDARYSDPNRTDLRIEVKSGASYDLKLDGPGQGGVPRQPGVPPSHGGVPPMPK
jgi:hypothetical protein